MPLFAIDLPQPQAREWNQHGTLATRRQATSRGVLHQASRFGVLLNIGPDEDRCFFLRCYRNPTTGADLPLGPRRVISSGLLARHIGLSTMEYRRHKLSGKTPGLYRLAGETQNETAFHRAIRGFPACSWGARSQGLGSDPILWMCLCFC